MCVQTTKTERIVQFLALDSSISSIDFDSLTRGYIIAMNGIKYGKIVERRICMTKNAFKFMELVCVKSQRSHVSSTSVKIAGTIPVTPSITNRAIKSQAK